MKYHPWVFINLVLFLTFIYVYGGVLGCSKLPLLYSSRSSGIFPCSLGYLALLVYFAIFWLIVTLISFLYSLKNKNAKNTLKISLKFMAVILIIFFSVPAYQKINEKVKNKKQQAIIVKSLQRRQNTSGNYQLLHCEDHLNTNNIIVLKCNLSVEMSGQYLIEGQLFKNNPLISGYDEIILESHLNEYTLNRKSDVEIPFEYKHIAKNKKVPDGPYVIKLSIIPTEDLRTQINDSTFSGFEPIENLKINDVYIDFLKTKHYSGTLFESLPYRSIKFTK